MEIDSDNFLQELQKLVGGYIEICGRIVSLNALYGERQALIVNEEGKLQGLPENLTATVTAGLVGFDMLVGDAILVKRKYDDILPFDNSDTSRQRFAACIGCKFDKQPKRVAAHHNNTPRLYRRAVCERR